MSNPLIETLLDQREVVKIIVTALSETIVGYTHVSVTAGKPHLQEKSDTENIAVAGFIRFESLKLSLELSLGFSRELFLILYENMFQTETAEISTENHDLAGEILNIAFGAMDPQFRTLGYKMKSSFPKIFSGSELREHLGKIAARSMVIPYTAGGKSFTVELYLGGSVPAHWEWGSKTSHGVSAA